MIWRLLREREAADDVQASLKLTRGGACAAVFTIAGCGEDEDEGDGGGGSAPKAFEISASGGGKNINLTAPASVPAG